MSTIPVHAIPVVAAPPPSLARLFTFARPDRSRRDEFFPAVAGFDIGSGSLVDVSYLYSFSRAPSTGVDRHLRTEEMFVPLDGDLCLPLAPCRDPSNPRDQPRAEDFVGVIVHHGQAVILNANVWHNGGWPVDADRGVRYIMVLSGHRAGAAGKEFLDFQTATLPAGTSILPRWSTP